MPAPRRATPIRPTIRAALIIEARTLALAAEAVDLAAHGADERRVAEATEALAEAHYGLLAYPEALAHYLAALERWQRQPRR